MDDVTDYDAGQGMVIPARMMGGIRRYIEQGILPGEFWQAVLRNDLRDAAGRADSTNERILPAYVRYLYNEAPADCWGSLEKVNAWVKRMERPTVGSRTNFTMTEEQEKRLLDAMKPVPYIFIGGLAPRSQQENANDAWRTLADELGFEWNTVEPVPGKGQRVFSAIVKAPKEGAA